MRPFGSWNLPATKGVSLVLRDNVGGNVVGGGGTSSGTYTFVPITFINISMQSVNAVEPIV
jgi:hypothetical protein